MTLMSVAERRTPCSDGPPPRMVSAVVLQGVASLRDATKMAGRCTFAILACSRIFYFGREL